jgi:imidazolonepropionase-like amidohydrolase
VSRLLVRDVAVIDATGRDPEGRHDVLIEDGRIASVAAEERAVAEGVPVVDGAGCTLLPGLTDAHVHLALIGGGASHTSDPWIFHVLAVAQMIEGALQEGFTTVRDAGGLEPSWARAVAEGILTGPRILPSGSVISQTGGHGDDRLAHHTLGTSVTIPGLVAGHVVADGVEEVRKAAREQLRRGATQIKLLASGGIVSPTDPFDSIQLSLEEIRVAVEVARNYDTYVLAHCHTSPAIEVALDAGVRSIEHASVLAPSTAKRMGELGTFMVPTLQAFEVLNAHPDDFGLTDDKIARLQGILAAAYESIGTAQEAGVSIASGSDVVGTLQGRRGEELVFKARALGAHGAIISATRTNAELFGLEDEIGTIEAGKRADLVLVRGEPLDDIGLLAEPDNVVVVIQGGAIRKDREGRLAA